MYLSQIRTNSCLTTSVSMSGVIGWCLGAGRPSIRGTVTPRRSRTLDVEGKAIDQDLPALRAPVDGQREAGVAHLQAAETGREGARGGGGGVDGGSGRPVRWRCSGQRLVNRVKRGNRWVQIGMCNVPRIQRIDQSMDRSPLESEGSMGRWVDGSNLPEPKGRHGRHEQGERSEEPEHRRTMYLLPNWHPC